MNERSKGRSAERSNVAILRVEGLQVQFRTEDGLVRAVDGVDFTLERGSILGIVGESGCGKSVTALSILQLVPRPHGSIAGGSIQFYGAVEDFAGHGSEIPTDNRTESLEYVEITKLDPLGSRMRSLRGNNIAMIFQEPMTSLNPVYTIGYQIVEGLKLHTNMNKRDAEMWAIDMLDRVGLPKPANVFRSYPHSLSGGMRQRAMIAMAFSCNPDLLLADEPTTALDVTTQAKILDIILSLQEQANMSTVMITHDLGVIAEMAHMVIVMYLGRIVERAPVRDVFHNAKHPYTQGLLKSIPGVGVRVKQKLNPIKGSVPDPYAKVNGCRFAPRCPHVMKKCVFVEPPLFSISEQQSAKCWLYEQ
jgi:oligopeptide/dipeptide ABC transporter ATP-binding protein